MPVRNTVRSPIPHTYYHVYNRGVNRRKIFLDYENYQFFSSLFQRHLSPEQQQSRTGQPYPHFQPQVSLLAFCLMPNHYHLLVYQKTDAMALSKLMTSIGTAYTMYFNRKYERRGPLFENRFKASPILDDAYLQHITRYIHLNPKEYKTWAWSSYRAYLNTGPRPLWLEPKPVLDLFKNPKDYEIFVNDYKSLHDELEAMKIDLANF